MRIGLLQLLKHPRRLDDDFMMESLTQFDVNAAKKRAAAGDVDRGDWLMIVHVFGIKLFGLLDGRPDGIDVRRQDSTQKPLTAFRI